MKIHIAKSGDTLYNLAKKYGLSLDELIAANTDIANPDEIEVGAKIRIPKPGQKQYEIAQDYTIQQGDTMWKLSKTFQVPLADLIAANPQIVNPSALMTGQVVHIPKLPAEGAGAPEGMHHHHHHDMPETGAMPAAGQKPSTAVMPGASEKPSTAVMPAETEKPSTAVMPAETEKPSTAVLPTPTEKPSTAPLPQPPQVTAPVEVQMPAPLPPAPPMPPVHEHYPVYMTTYEHTTDLFLQMPQPAVEASTAPAGYGQSYEAVSTAASHGYGYGQTHSATANPATAMPYSFGDISPASAMPTGYNAVSPASTMPTGYNAVSPASTMPTGYNAVSPASAMPTGYNAVSPASTMPTGYNAVSPASTMPTGYNAVSPASTMPTGYGAVSPASGHGYSYNGYGSAVSPAGIQPYAGAPCVEGIGPLVGGIPAYPGQLGGLEGGIPGHLGGLEGGIPGHLGGLEGGIPGHLGGLQGGIPGHLGGLEGGIPGHIGGLEGGIPGHLGGLEGGIPGHLGGLGGLQTGWGPAPCQPCAGTPVSPAAAMYPAHESGYGYSSGVMPVQTAVSPASTGYAPSAVSPISTGYAPSAVSPVSTGYAPYAAAPSAVSPAAAGPGGGHYGYGYDPRFPLTAGYGAQPFATDYSLPYRDGFGFVDNPLAGGPSDAPNKDLAYAQAENASERLSDEARFEDEEDALAEAKPKIGVAKAARSAAQRQGTAKRVASSSAGKAQARVASAPKNRKSLPWIKW